MKLRIKGNSIRIRVTQSEISSLAEKGEIRESIQFPGKALSYLLRVSDQTSLTAVMESDSIVIEIPGELAKQWTSTDVITIAGSQSIDSGDLQILVEKDFKCLDERINEDETDLFPNPKQEC